MNDNWDAPVIMKALTIYQPHASLVACGAKRFETRSRPTHYRGPIAVHAGLAKVEFKATSDAEFMKAAEEALDFKFLRKFSDKLYPPRYFAPKSLPHGAVIATAEIVGCWPIFASDGKCAVVGHAHQKGQAAVRGNELLFGDWTPGRYALELANAQMLPEPIPCRGQQGLWNWEVNP